MDAKRKKAVRESSSKDDKKSSSEEQNDANKKMDTRQHANRNMNKRRRLLGATDAEIVSSANNSSSQATIEALHSTDTTSSHLSSESNIRVPRYRDVLLGRGRGIQTSNGNYLMREIVQRYRETYRTTPRSQRREISEQVLDEIIATGARFLRRIENDLGHELWEEVDRSLAHDKVSHALREKKYTQGGSYDESNVEQQDISSTTVHEVSQDDPLSNAGQSLPQEISAGGSSSGPEPAANSSNAPSSLMSTSLLGTTQNNYTDTSLQHAAALLLQHIQQEYMSATTLSSATAFIQSLLTQIHPQPPSGISPSYDQQLQNRQYPPLIDLAALINQRVSNTPLSAEVLALTGASNHAHQLPFVSPGSNVTAVTGSNMTFSSQGQPPDALSSAMAWVHLLLNNGHLPPVFTNVLHNHVRLGLQNVFSGATGVGRHMQSNINDTYNVLEALRVASNINFPSLGVVVDNSNSSGTNAHEQSRSSPALQDSRNHSSTMTGKDASSGKDESKRGSKDD